MSNSLCRPPIASNKRTCNQCFGDSMDEELSSVPCPNSEGGELCSNILTKKNKFCPECGWKVNYSIFQKRQQSSVSDDNVYICDGLDDDGQICGQQLLPAMKFCSNCGEKRKKLPRLDLSNMSSESMSLSSHTVSEEIQINVAECLSVENMKNNESGSLETRLPEADEKQLYVDLLKKVSSQELSTEEEVFETASFQMGGQNSTFKKNSVIEISDISTELENRNEGEASVEELESSVDSKASSDQKSFKSEIRLGLINDKMLHDDVESEDAVTAGDVNMHINKVCKEVVLHDIRSAEPEVPDCKQEAFGVVRSEKENLEKDDLRGIGPAVEDVYGVSVVADKDGDEALSLKQLNTSRKRDSDKGFKSPQKAGKGDDGHSESVSSRGHDQKSVVIIKEDNASTNADNLASAATQMSECFPSMADSKVALMTIVDENNMQREVTVLPPKKHRDNDELKINSHQKPRVITTRSTAKDQMQSKKIKLHFHVALSKDDFKFKGERVIMKFDNNDLGGWRSNKWVMKQEKIIDEKNVLMTLDVEIEKDQLLAGRAIEYKYAILRCEDKVDYEFIPKKDEYRKIVNRILKIPREQLQMCIEWHQYDGIMSTEPEGLWSKFVNKFTDQFVKRTKEAVLAMLPSWDEIEGAEKQPTKSVLERLDQVCFCARTCFLNEKLTPDESKLQDCLQEYVEPIMQRLEAYLARRHHESEFEGGIRIATACALVYIMQKYELKFDSRDTKRLFRSLLLNPPKDIKVCSDYQQLTELHFPTAEWKRRIKDSLLYFVSRMSTKEFVEPLWLLAVPVLHFLGDYIKPGTAPKTDNNHEKPSWWGIDGFKSLVDDFKRLNEKNMPIGQYLEVLSPLFEVDRLLPRTLMAVMNLDLHIPLLYKTGLFPIDVCLANMYYFAKTTKEIEKILSGLKQLEELTDKWLSEFKPSDAKQIDEKYMDLGVQMKMSLNLLDKVCERMPWLKVDSVHVMTSASRIAANYVSNVEKLVTIVQEVDETKELTKVKEWKQIIQNSLDELTRKVFGWISKASQYHLAKLSYGGSDFTCPIIEYDEIQLYAYLYEVQFHEMVTTAQWKAILDQCVTKRLKELSPYLQILVFSDVDFTKYPPEVEMCFSKVAFDVIENVENTRHGDFGYMFDLLDRRVSTSKLQDLLSRMFEKSWPKSNENKPSNEEGIVLIHILTWPSFKRYLGLFYGQSRKTGLLSEDCVELIQVAMSVYDAMIEKLLLGSLTVSQLKLLLDNKLKGSFFELFKISEKNSEMGMKNVPESGLKGINKAGVLMKVLVWRQLEVQAFEEFCCRLSHFLNQCAILKSGELEKMSQLLLGNHGKLLISEFCQPMKYSPETAKCPNYRPHVTYFQLTPDGVKMVDFVWGKKDSILFGDLWKSFLMKLAEKPSDFGLADVLKVWQSSCQAFRRLCDEIRSGEITFKKVDNVFGGFGRKYELIEKELSIFAENDVVLRRWKQIEQYHQLDQYSRGASIMLQLRDKFNLTGDFTVVEVLADMVKDKNKTLVDITEELVNSGKQLEGITDKKVECLDVFLKNKKFADWLRKSIKGPKEVKVLVDLAMISAEGQGDMEVQKVSCLHAAATGYAPLIYDLTPNMNFLEFLPLCQAVWRMLEVDNNLPKKFRDTALHLDWLNRVKESHGSVELNALANAQAINTKGIYSVGNLGKSRKALDGVVELSLRLEKGDRDIETEAFVSEEVEKRKWQTLGLQQLNDLQSKLMLVAGKAQEGKKDVDIFVEILDGVTRLGSLYVRICNAGCSLFHHWKAMFYCDSMKPMYARVEFGKDGKHIFCGWKKDAVNGVCGYIHDLCTFMEGCLTEWLEHIERQRTDLYYLNYFTTEQLVLLQNELPKINADKTKVSRHIYPILSLVKKSCTLRDIEDAIYLAFKRLEDTEKKAAAAAASDKTAMEVEESNESSELQQQESVQKFLDAMTEAGYSLKMAKRALKECGVGNIEEGLLWCMMQLDSLKEDEEEDLESDEGSNVDLIAPEKIGEKREDIKFTGLHLDTTMEALTANLFQAPNLTNRLELLTKRLQELWKMYQNEMNTSLADYLSIKHLGCILEILAAAGYKRSDRQLPGYIKKGRPNLILCSQAEIYPVVLSIYMNGNAQKNSLPGLDEVLVCTANTTAEDVELLWRRAEGDARNGFHGKIYCVVHAELLDYDVARKAEQSLDKHKHAADEIQLVVICCREQEDRSHMINALDRYRVKLPLIEMEDVRAYLKQHLTIAGPTVVRPAAELDPERCSVRLIKSHRAGVGKSLKVRRLLEQRQNWNLPNRGYDGSFLISIPLHNKKVDPSVVLKRLLQHSLEPSIVVPRIFHIDIAHEVQEGVDYLLFNLLILGSFTDREGYVWSRLPTDVYLIETMPLMQREAKAPEKRQQELQCVHHVFHLLPSMTCWSPIDSLNILNGTSNAVKERYMNVIVADHDQKMDDKEFRGAMIQRPFQYLMRFARGQELHGVQSHVPEGDCIECIQCLLAHCGIRDPSWSELRHFVNFLNVQLRSCEDSIFCSPFLAPDLPGFLKFVVKFMIQMSKDFATRSLTISEETPEVVMQLLDQENPEAEDILGHYGLKRRWETSPHPYLFFNADGNSFTFMGFVINANTGDILEPGTNRILTQQALPQQLYEALIRNRVNLGENFDALQRWQKIEKMCCVIGIEMVHDPDDTYELTADNVKKMLAIYMRFRCDIPVIVMGETGCGKTRLIKFMCDLWKPPGSDMTNMVLMKVHGGTTAADIERKVREAAELAQLNREEYPDVQTVLFFDEANTTEAIGMIKEIMCDHTIGGEKLPSTYGLKLIAACNPYRKHSDEMIQRLEHAGLGYHVQANQTADRLGRIPMRQLVYRVQALPQSMLPLVWDFGQLSTEVETLYIKQMVHRYVSTDPVLSAVPKLEDTVSRILAASQEFMRNQKDECSFVSLRDVDRALRVMMWFYPHEKELFDKMNQKAVDEIEKTLVDDDDDEEEDEEQNDSLIYAPPNDLTRALILALGVCYHACLQKRSEYRKFIAHYFVGPCQLENGAETIEKNINWCQEVFLDEVELGENIARNQALKENLFMMVICIELRIPLFLVGKPGSSKSLAKTIVADAMQGEAARSELFRTLKSVHMVSYQCSPLSTPEGIVGTFRQCAKLQEGQDLNKFVSVVVLDEVGLAEDSDRMPLKTLHPLLEDGCEGDEIPAAHKKVGFIGISNWALDPAKMNRGILVQRGVPDELELEQSAKGICAKEPIIMRRIETVVQPMAKAYLELYESALEIREFFGLRDFYSLIKMIYGFMKHSGQLPTWAELKHAILRNFGGLDNIHPVEVFEKHLQNIDKNQPPKPTDPQCDSASLIRCSLSGDELDSESRYLLILTENYAALGLLQHELLKMKDAIIIFGSSFPKDQEYTQVCRNINRIKVCMETGRTVVLLNLENLYESLYDALNQYYVVLGDQRFVDLGLGTQRVKCRVHQSFRLIVVAEKQVVYDKFPIPLINRLEKHFLAMSTMLTEDQVEIVKRVQQWANDFAKILTGQQRSNNQPKPGDVFIGYHADTAASLVLQVSHLGTRDKEKILDEAKDLLLCCAVPEAILRLSNTRLAASADKIYRKYFEEQCHSNLEDLLKRIIVDLNAVENLFVQVTTHSRLLLPRDVIHIAKVLNLKRGDVVLEALHAFGTEQQFCRMLKEFFSGGQSRGRVLLLQCDSGDVHSDLIACARYNIWNEFLQTLVDGNGNDRVPMHIIFIIQLPRIAGGCFIGFQGGKWLSYHIDDLHSHDERIPPLMAMKGRSLGTLFETASAAKGLCKEPMEEDTSENFGEEQVEQVVTEEDPTAEPMDVEEQGNKSTEPVSEGMETVTRLRRRQDGVKFTREKFVAELDVDSIIRSCLHSSAAMLKDSAKEEAVKLRKTHRLQLLVMLMDKQEDGEKESILNVIWKRLTLLLKDKEETAMTATMASGWLSNEAASFEAICRAGTFRRALWQYLETKVTPLLAGILSYADTNANLDILEQIDQNNCWIESMWLDMLNSSDITMFKYRDLQTATQRMELTEFEVKSTGAHGTFFQALLPFSWIIKEQTDCLIYIAKQDATKHARSMAENALSTSSLGKVIEKAGVEGGLENVIERYLADFVHMVYHPQSRLLDEEHELVVRDMKYALRCQCLEELAGNRDEEHFMTTSSYLQTSIPHVHLVYESIRKRLMIFSDMVQIWPESARFLAQEEKNMPLDLQCLLLLTEVWLVPKKEELENVNTRKKWIDRVRLATPVVLQLLESVADVTKENVQHRDSCRYMWNRIGAVQLFIEHVCPTDDADLIRSIQWCWTLWMMLKDNTDFKTAESFNKVELFFYTCNKKASELFFGKQDNCPGCEKMVEYPVRLPCDHIVCALCLVELKETKNCYCPKAHCLKGFPPNFKAQPVVAQKNGREKFAKYKQQCNSFFMDIVSRFCFTGNTPPEVDVIHKLMGYVTCKSKLACIRQGTGVGDVESTMAKTKKMFEESLDPTPVVRSFLLQLLLLADIDTVYEYLEEYFQNAQTLVQTDPSQVVELCMLCVQCLEDHYHRQSTQINLDIDRLHFARHLLLKSSTLLRGDTMGVEINTLEAVAKVRHGLTEAAYWIHRLYIARDVKRTLPIEVRRLCDAAAHICDQDQLRWPRIYLMRQLARRYGIDTLKQLSELQNLHWIIPKEARENQNDTRPDRFIVCGDDYRQLRELAAEILISKDVGPFQNALQALQGSDEIIECTALLAIYREVTASNFHNDEQRRPTPEIVQLLQQFCQNCPAFKNKDLTLAIVANKLNGCLHVNPGHSAMEHSLAELLTHFKILLTNSQNNGLQKPFVDFILTPQQMQNAFLPTMPQDDMDDVRAVIGSMAPGETPTFYQCPNGHPYVIGNCGRPVAMGTCLQCGAPVGGTGYVLQAGNAALVANIDNTRRGHILGEPQKRAPIPERQMSPAATAVLRMLLHMSMYLGSLENPQAIAQLIIPQVDPQNISRVLFDHIQIDIDTIHNAVGHSHDDVLVFVHILIDFMFRNIVHVAGLDLRLQDKPSRLNWENAYVNAYIAPTLNGLNAKLQETNNKMVNDDRLGNNPLLKTIFEVDVSATKPTVRKVHDDPSLWRFRAQISLEHLALALDENLALKQGNEEKKEKQLQLFPVLQLFLKDEHQLRAIRLLPSILHLHRLLLQKLNRCLDSSDATTMTIGEFLDSVNDENQRAELRRLVGDFSDAWDRIRQSLPNYPFGGYTVPVEYTQVTVNEESRLAMLLPSLRGWGLCSVALVFFLQDLQNNFMENYSKETRQPLSARVDVYDTSYAHLVAYHPVHDLQPIILANCNYSLEVGKGTTVDYDFGNMEKQIIERFIRGRPRLGIGQMEFIRYREDFTNAVTFKQLRHRIPQEPLPFLADLDHEFRHKTTDVTDLLASLDIAIGFLVSIGGDPSHSILQFMVETIKMKQLHAVSLLQKCKLKHVESLWLLLSYLRAKMQASYGHEAFDKVEDKYREPVPEELRQKLRLAFQHIQMDAFQLLLFECIIFNITVKQNANDEDYTDNSNYSLKDVLVLYMSDSGSNNTIPALEDGRFPDEIKAKHCIATWLLALGLNRP